MIRILAVPGLVLLLVGCSSTAHDTPTSSRPARAASSTATPTPLATYTDPAGATARTCIEFQELLADLEAAPPTSDLSTLKAVAAKIQIDAHNSGQLSGNDPRYAQLITDTDALITYVNSQGFAQTGDITGPAVQAMQADCPAS